MDLSKKVLKVKKKCLDMCIAAGAGHVTSAFSCVEIVATLYYEVMNINPQKPFWEDRDRFVMSKNHASVITYPVLEDLGFLSKGSCDTFLQDGSPIGIHTKQTVPGVDFCGGALGIGIGVACGLAYAAKLDKKSWLTFCLVGDGECYEGSVWEAAMFASAKDLNNLVVFVDRNQLCITDFTEKMLPLESLPRKWDAFGWEVREINGHDTKQIKNALGDVRQRTEKPLCIIANTIKGNGVSFMENQPLWHGRAPIKENAQEAQREVSG